jgi:GTP cyclohydrolase I
MLVAIGEDPSREGLVETPRRVAESIDELVRPRGVGVVVEARHMCVEMRGVGKFDSDTVTSCVLGEVRDDPAVAARFTQLIGGLTRREGPPSLEV